MIDLQRMNILFGSVWILIPHVLNKLVHTNNIPHIFYWIQQIAEESAHKNELQMQLDSKESDIEQLRSKINDLQLGMDSTSVASLPPDDTDGNVIGKRHRCFAYYLCILFTRLFFSI